MTSLPGLTADELALVDRQYADRPQLRPVLDALLAALPRIGDVRVVVRTKQVSLVGPMRTFAYIQPTTPRRVDVRLRLVAPAPGGRIVAVTRRDVVEFGVRLALGAAGDVDDEIVGWLRRAHDEHGAPRVRRVPRRRPPRSELCRIEIAIEASDLPGRTCSPDADGRPYANIHAGLVTATRREDGVRVAPSRPWTVTGLVPGDAAAARWTLEALVARNEDGLDLTGPALRGRRGARHIGISWGELLGDGSFAMFRGLGLRVRDIPADLVEAATRPGHRLVARLGLTDASGNPRCAGVPRTDVTWTVEAVEG
ncbi:MAG TPA: DUF5990 family protein [Candidatus Dormibacteraeota bacterium]|nr:DUF5990 family protein [Candidatus Dormibacteraeota bacterium]